MDIKIGTIRGLETGGMQGREDSLSKDWVPRKLDPKTQL